MVHYFSHHARILLAARHRILSAFSRRERREVLRRIAPANRAAPRLRLSRNRRISAYSHHPSEKLRSVAHGLCGDEYLKTDLETALRNLVTMMERRAGLVCTCTRTGELPQFSAAANVHLYHIVQEALRNAVKHAKASAIHVGMEADEMTLVVSVVDDGIGVSNEGPDLSGVGLLHMEERARLIGGWLRIDRAYGGGTVVRVVVPLSTTRMLAD